MAQQDPSKRQDNKNSTPTSDIAPGEPLWIPQNHDQESSGQGYDHHDPISLLKGSKQLGNAITRFGKFGFKPSMNVHGEDHGKVFKIPILREEGSKGEWKVVIKQDLKNSTGLLGDFRTIKENGHDVCKIDLDLWSLNKDKPGFVWDPVEKEIELTFVDGEEEKIIEAVVPYRTSCKILLPDVLRQEVTYRVQEYQAKSANVYGGYSRGSGHKTAYGCGSTYHWNYGASWDSSTRYIPWYDSTSKVTESNIGSHSVYYKVYTLPMPRSWIENIVGNREYLNDFDKNHPYRLTNNTERPPTLPNRDDDFTKPDVEADGIVARYDHTDKLQLVLGKTRFTNFASRRSDPSCSCRTHEYAKVWVSNDKRISHRDHGYVNSSVYSMTMYDPDTTAGATALQALADMYKAWPLNHLTYWDGMGPLHMFSYGTYQVMEETTNMSGGTSSGCGGSRYLWYGQGNDCNDPGDIYKVGTVPVPQQSFDFRDHTDDPYHNYYYNIAEFDKIGDPGDTRLPYGGARYGSPAKRFVPPSTYHPAGNHVNLFHSEWWSRYNSYSSAVDLRTDTKDWHGAWSLDIPYADQSWYQSVRYLVTDKPEFDYSDTLTVGNHKWIDSYPEDIILNVGNKFTGVGDIAHVMFNHNGTLPGEYYNQEPVHVMGSEDPSNIMTNYNTPRLQDGWKTGRESGYNTNRWDCHNRGKHGGSQFKQGWYTHYLGDHTDQWLKNNHTPLSAGALDDRDNTSYKPTWTGYKWDGKQRDTRNGAGAGVVLGNGSPGHGEDGTSRYLYDCSDIAHPLSSYEMNDNNLKGHYLCCTDHLDRHIVLNLTRKNEDDPINLGVTRMRLLINKAEEYDLKRHSTYDRRVLVDHEISVGPTFTSTQDWAVAPSNQSVTDRLFTGVGAKPTSPVLFLGLTATVIPGGTLENPSRIEPPEPCQIVMIPNQRTVSETVSKGNAKTWTRTFTNIGEVEGVVKFTNTYTAYQGTYQFIAADPTGTPPVPVAKWVGDKLIDWSYTIQEPFRRGPTGFDNTVSLSANESVVVEYAVDVTTDNLAGYEVGLSHIIENTGKAPETEAVRFDIDV
jgi:hypothetical protein